MNKSVWPLEYTSWITLTENPFFCVYPLDTNFIQTELPINVTAPGFLLSHFSMINCAFSSSPFLIAMKSRHRSLYGSFSNSKSPINWMRNGVLFWKRITFSQFWRGGYFIFGYPGDVMIASTWPIPLVSEHMSMSELEKYLI